jgi:hypothetical protein
VLFGDSLVPAASADPAAWLADALSGDVGTVGGLLPEHYGSYLLLEAATAEDDDWWGAQRQIMSAVAEVLTEFTDTPSQSWFAIWEGHGYDTRQSSLYWKGEPTTAERAEIEVRQAELRAEDARLEAWVHDELRRIPTFDLPDRTYYLLSGHVSDVGAIRWPGETERWFRPDLWWPTDRQWFVGTDVDFWCNYVGGSLAMTDALSARFPERCHRVSVHDGLRVEE